MASLGTCVLGMSTVKGLTTAAACTSTHLASILYDTSTVAEDVDVPLDVKNWIGSLSAGVGVHELVFRETDGAYDLGWHTAPCRQFIIMTNGRPPPPHSHCSVFEDAWVHVHKVQTQLFSFGCQQWSV